MAIYEVRSRDREALDKAREGVRRYQTVWWVPDAQLFYMRLSHKHASVARNLKGVVVREVDEVPAEFLPRVEEQDYEEGKDILDELPMEVLVETLERRVWYMQQEVEEEKRREAEEMEAGLGRVDSTYRPQIAAKDADIGRLEQAAERLKAAIAP